MLDPARLFAAFDRAGMLTGAVWNGALQVRGDFRSATVDVLGVIAPGPRFALPEQAIPQAAAGDTLDIGAVRYTVASIERDGVGTMTLQLQRQ